MVIMLLAQFSRKLGAAGEFAALEELSFATMGQRGMQCPFEVRYHCERHPCMN
eukprot:SAG31_NODE_32613_length_353_cov_1.169291_1_plen_52_part_01